MRRTLYHYSLPFRGGGLREGFLLHLREQGEEGWGEIAPLPGFSRESLEEAFEDFCTYRYTLPSVQFGVYSALCDLRGRVSLRAVPIKIKVKVGDLTLRECLRVINPAPTSYMRVDFNRRWSLHEALSFAEHFSEVEYFEEPLLPGEDARLFPYPVALDESLREGAFPPYPNVVAHVIKPTMHGVPLPAIQRGVDFILSSSYETELGIHQIAKLSLRLKLPDRPMGLGTCHLFEDSLFENGVHMEEDMLYFPEEWRLKRGRVQNIFDEYI